MEKEPTGLKSFSSTYWLLNIIEMWERLAYYVLRPVAPIYIAQATEPGGLHMSQTYKGWLYAFWAGFQSLLPMVTGGYADRYGYKKTLFLSITLNIIGYLMMAFFHDPVGFFAAIIVLAIGTAFFKPSLQGTLAHNVSKANSSLGWGIFYWVVNVGSLLGHYLSPLFLGNPHSAEGWKTLFLFCAGFTAMNYVMLFTYKDVPSGASKTANPFQVFFRTLANIFEPRLITWLLIMSCFWLMMYQLWDLQPNFIEDWVDSSGVASLPLPDAWREMGDIGKVRVPQQVLISLNALMIVLFMVPVSWMVRKLRTLSAMFMGMIVATMGVLVAGWTGNGWILLLGILFFSMGEMLTGPKKNEYLGLIAPPGKKGTYLGYVNIPVGVGVFLGSVIAGYVYGGYGEKATLALKYMGTDNRLVARAAKSADWSDSLDKIPELLGIERGAALDRACEHLGMDKDAAAGRLRALYHFDQGQVTNLALRYLKDDPEYGEKTVARVEALPLVRERFNENLEEGRMKDDAGIAAMLWERYGADGEVVNDLALEYLAQATDGIYDAVLQMNFANPVEDIEEAVGIGRTKAFAALSSARGVEKKEMVEMLTREYPHVEDPVDRVFLYIIGQGQEGKQTHHRFLAVARMEWFKNIPMLKEMIDLAAPVYLEVNEEVEEEEDPYSELALDMDLVQKAFNLKDDWTPEQAARLLGLNPFEASAKAAADLNRSPEKTTRLLWETYDPQYHVWIPFAMIGVVAAIALYIFGRMARRWSDMNA